MKTYKRVIIIVVLLIPFLAYIPIRLSLTYYTPAPKVLQEKFAQEGCFYDSAKNCYQIPGVDFGRGLSETVADLGLNEWLSKSDIDLHKDSDSESYYKIKTDPLIVSALNAKYSFTISMSKYNECYQLGLIGSFAYNPRTTYLFENSIKYNDACTYFYNLYNEFVASYGEPDKSDFSLNLNEITPDAFPSDRSYYPEVYAYWTTGEEGHQSVLRLSATPYHTEDTKSNQVMYLMVRIDIGQEMEGVSIDYLTSRRLWGLSKELQ
ncbi:hypothetical protein AAFA46_05495 [Oscillospiraceae bacterium WX1]